jgi:hypothetical protein
MLENLKIRIPQVIWMIFTGLSGYQGCQMLWAGPSATGVANILICLGFAALALCWRRIVYYFASSPAVLRGGSLALILIFGVVYYWPF